MNLNYYDIFNKIYLNGHWAGCGSGSGSIDRNTVDYRQMLDEFIINYKIKSCFDIGCGDFQIMRHIYKKFEKYYGIDVASVCVERNIELYSSDKCKFELINVLDDSFVMPEYELVIIKDVLQHLPNDDIKKIIKLIRDFKYVIIVNDFGSNGNRVINPGEYRGVDILSSPFNFDGKLYKLLHNKKHVCVRGF